jgi:ribosome biogenesis protein BMS1
MAKPTGNKVKGGKAKKQRATEHKKRKAEASGGAAAAGGDDGGKDIGVGAAPSGNQRNPKAFIFSGQGKAKRQAARTAEKDQRRMHGASLNPISDPDSCDQA